MVLPGRIGRCRTDPSVEPVRDGRLPFRRRPAERVAVRACRCCCSRSCRPGPALRLFIVFNPLLAGLAMYVFLRKESIGRAAAAAGGLVMAMMMSTSTIAISLPFAGALAWTAVLLVAASGIPASGRMVRSFRVAGARRLLLDAGGGGAPEPRSRDRDGVRDDVSRGRCGR